MPRLRLRISIYAIPTLLLMLWLEGFAPFILLLSSAFVHELGHLWAMHLSERKPRRIDILPMGAVIVCPEGIPHGWEALIAISGPAFSFVGAIIAIIAFCATGHALALYAIVINLALATFNLLPVKKLDGGKAMQSFLLYKNTKEKAAKQICFAASVISKCIFAFVAITCVVISNFNLGVITLASALLVQILFD